MPAAAGRRRPRILVVATLAEVGGVASYLASLLPGLTQDFDVTVAAHGPGPLPEIARASGADYAPLRHVRRRINPARDLIGLVELVRLFRELQPDIVHLNSSKAGALGRAAATVARVPIRVFAVHGWATSAHGGVAGRAYEVVDRLARHVTTTVVCVADSERVAGLARALCLPDRTVVIHNAVDCDEADGGGERPGRRSRPVIVSVARLRHPKDPATLVRALARLEPGSFTASFVGDGPLRTELEREISTARMATTVELLGERSDVRELLAGADIFVLSSRSEALPMSILEAMRAGLPVVATNVGGVPELVVPGETGALVAPGDADGLARELRQLVVNPELRERLGNAGRARAEGRFDVAAFRHAYVELFRGLLAERGLAPPQGHRTLHESAELPEQATAVAVDRVPQHRVGSGC